MNKLALLILAIPALLLSSCNHKELCYHHEYRVRIVFDWENAPDANPASMNAQHFDCSESIPPQRFSFPGRDGGFITTSPGIYSGIAFNDDITYWAQVRNTVDIAAYEILTKDAVALETLGLSTAVLPRCRGAEDERMASTPEMLWADGKDNIDVNFLHGETVITYYPEEAICHYTVTVLDIAGFENLRDRSVDATLTGMAEGFMPYLELPSPTRVTHPYVLSSTSRPNSLYSEFLTFGVPTNSDHRHYVVLYTVYENGEGAYHTYDVTDQVRGAPDPRHVDIVIRGMEIPRPIGGGGNLDVTVNDWLTDDDIHIEM